MKAAQGKNEIKLMSENQFPPLIVETTVNIPVICVN